MAEKRVLICGGGTGGHLYPALAVGAKLRSIEPGMRLLYAISHREVERKIMERHGVDFVPIRIEGLKGWGLHKVPALFMLLGAFRRSNRLLREFKPGLVIGAGGYSSGPLVLLASMKGIPTLILEQNAIPGFTNRLLARRVDRAVVAFPGTAGCFGPKGVYLGNPVREGFENMPPKPEGPGLDVLVFGGSQGSHFLNEKFTACLPLLAGRRDDLRITHQTGAREYEKVRAAYEAAGFDGGRVAPFYNDMAARFAAADLIISRAGATSCAELIAARKAAILVPFAEAADDHQTRNARELEAVGGAEVMTEAGTTPELLAGRILHYLADKGALGRMADKLGSLRTEKAADRIAALCLDLMTGAADGGKK